MSEKQAMLLSDYRVVLCRDRDKAGKAGTTKMSSMITAIETAKKTTEKLLYVIPPNGYNDWNEFLIKNNAVLLHHYVLKNQKSLDYSGPRGTIGDYFGFSDIWR
jgi:DNA primase